MARRGRFLERQAQRLRRSALLVSVVSVVLGGLAIAAVSWWTLWLLLGAKSDTPNQLDLTKIALSVAAGVGGAVALVVSYRKQRDNERGRFAQLFGAAAAQLGHADVAVRMAGVYAMAGVADEFSARGRRQQCIDVLCGYLRLPYDPAEGATHLSSRTTTDETAGAEVERVYQLRQNDREVRRTIVAVIVSHLRPQAEISWSDCDFNFDDAVLEDVDFRWAVFAGRHTHLRGTHFIGARSANFENVRFVGKHVTFHSARFDSDALFRGTCFTPAAADLETGRAGTSFVDAVFRGKADFTEAEFGGPRTRFTGAEFTGPASFTRARFTADATAFDRVRFAGEHAEFLGTVIDSAQITFADSRFDAARTSLDGARIGAGAGVPDFAGVTCGGRVSAEGAVLRGRPGALDCAAAGSSSAAAASRVDARTATEDLDAAGRDETQKPVDPDGETADALDGGGRTVGRSG
ncbi:pentapeptide repeat-containing protein [Nocardia veterana]|uniref:Pentapeptide repeat-containing protein n=1 Tax=Nocardia veterana TaxID=132249 RepID=A0A7X6RKA3_9NOCA|nr:pentapeptide repeat-containing protein [Nocardia veterana]NKY88444.1 pentapeptide repeat-containing protein [Nocardia veterana]